VQRARASPSQQLDAALKAHDRDRIAAHDAPRPGAPHGNRARARALVGVVPPGLTRVFYSRCRSRPLGVEAALRIALQWHPASAADTLRDALRVAGRGVSRRQHARRRSAVGYSRDLSPASSPRRRPGRRAALRPPHVVSLAARDSTSDDCASRRASPTPRARPRREHAARHARRLHRRATSCQGAGRHVDASTGVPSRRSTALAKRHGALFIADEVRDSASAAPAAMFACEHAAASRPTSSARPKGITGGYLPLARHASRTRRASSTRSSPHTTSSRPSSTASHYTGNALASARSRTRSLRVLRGGAGRSKRLGPKIARSHARLRRRESAPLAHVGDVRQQGFMVRGSSCVADREVRRPYAPGRAHGPSDDPRARGGRGVIAAPARGTCSS
jgi:hypothetical protein